MTTEQMISELRRDPTKRFRLAHGLKNAYVTVNEHHMIVWQGTGQSGQPMFVTLKGYEWIEYEGEKK